MVVLGFEYLGTYLLSEEAAVVLVADVLDFGMTLVPTAVCVPALF